MRIFLKFALAGLACLFAATLSAQASRTWISGVGDDANPGSRTAPCKTFAGAISKTAAGGEVDCLDPGGFGAVTITKSITLDGGGGQVASILVAGTNGIVIQAAATDVVTIRNLRFQGLRNSGSPGLNGIYFISGKALIIENCFIDGFSQSGIYVKTAAAADVHVSNTSIGNCNNGVTVDPANTGAVDLSLVNVQAWESSNVGFDLVGIGKARVSECEADGGVYGLVVDKADVQIDRLRATQNSFAGIQIASGTLRMANSVVSGNANGVRVLGGTLNSYGNNQVDGNTSANGPLTTTPQK